MPPPLPDGPWDLVISVLTVHHLDADQKIFLRLGPDALRGLAGQSGGQ